MTQNISEIFSETELVVSLLYAAQNGDEEAVRRMYLQGQPLDVKDYDGRTALHIAASEGHAHLVKFFLFIAKVPHNPKDRWSRTPLDDAKMFKHDECVKLLLRPHLLNHKGTLIEENEIDEIRSTTLSMQRMDTSSSDETESDSEIDQKLGFSDTYSGELKKKNGKGTI